MRLNDFALKARRAHPQGVLLACQLQPAWSARWNYLGRPRGFQSILLTQNG
jgi:hypothetical protein